MGIMKKEEAIKLPLGVGPRALAFVDRSQSTAPAICSWSATFFLDSPVLRNFAIASNKVFVDLQNEVQIFYPEPVPQRIVTSFSRMYRGLMLELVGNLKAEDQEDLSRSEMYSNLEFIWNFCEIMFIASHPDLLVLPYLVDWIKINFNQSPDLLPDIFAAVPDLSDPTLSANLWTLIYSAVFHGDGPAAAKLVKFVKHLSRENATSVVLDRQIELMVEVLGKKPSYDPEFGSVGEFENSFSAWQDEVLNRVENGAWSGNDNFVFIGKVLCGDADAFEEALGKNIMSWYEYLLLQLNYKYPSITPRLLKGYAVDTLRRAGQLEGLTNRDAILLAAMDYDIFTALREIQGLWDSPWFALHFSDLCLAVGGGDLNFGGNGAMLAPLRNSLLLEYGGQIMEHEEVWQLGIYYLETLPEREGHGVIRECLARRAPSSELEATKILQVAEKFGFGDEIRGICRQICLRKLSLRQPQAALLWAIKAGDGPLTTRIVDGILFEGNCEIEASLLESLKDVIPSANSLVFLNGFCAFRKSMEAKEFKSAISTLVELIKNDLIPKRIAAKILLKNQEIFSDGGNFIEPGTVHILMEFLHTKVPPGALSAEERQELNTQLIRARAAEIMTGFNGKKGVC